MKHVMMIFHILKLMDRADVIKNVTSLCMIMMKSRSIEKEILDLGSGYTLDEYRQCLDTLFTINKHLGFLRSTYHFLKRLEAPSTILDVGCGSGKLLLALSQCLKQHHYYGIDISSEAIALANEHLTSAKFQNDKPEVFYEVRNANELLKPNSFDVILATLFCHHLSDDELILFLENVFSAAKQYVIINDLHRHTLSYFLFSIISRIFYRNRLIIHDGLISIKKGFCYSDWQALLKAAKISNYKITWQFPFRWQIILWKN